MQDTNSNISDEREAYRMTESAVFRSRKRTAVLLGSCLLIVGLALSLLTLVSPSTSASAAPPRNAGWLSVNPTILDNLGTNRACGYDTHGGAPYVGCTITLKNTSTRNSVRWTATSSNPRLALTMKSGRLAPNASVKIHFYEGGLACPDNSTITFTGQFNVVKVPVICNDIVVTPNKYSFSSKSCTRDRRGTWTCMVRVSADPKDSKPVQWTSKVQGSPAAIAAVKVFPAYGTVSFERRGRMSIDRSQFVKITIPASWGCKAVSIFFYVPGTPQISRPQNILNWNCPRR